MNMHEIYAAALHRAAAGQSKERELELADSFLALLRSRGHERLLPKILRSFERHRAREKRGAAITVAREHDYERHKDAIDEALAQLQTFPARITLDERVIGGYRVVSREWVIDRTYRTQLVNLYKRLVTAAS